MMNTSSALDPQSPQARAIYDLGIDWARFFCFDLGGMTLCSSALAAALTQHEER
jgi:hypothetical protein